MVCSFPCLGMLPVAGERLPSLTIRSEVISSGPWLDSLFSVLMDAESKQLCLLAKLFISRFLSLSLSPPSVCQWSPQPFCSCLHCSYKTKPFCSPLVRIHITLLIGYINCVWLKHICRGKKRKMHKSPTRGNNYLLKLKGHLHYQSDPL